MIVCIIAEGSYPYVTGGVSSWIDQLIRGMPQIKFKLLSLMPSQESIPVRRYELPGNLIEIKTIYMDEYKNLKHRSIPPPIVLNNIEKRELEKLLSFDPSIDWKSISRIISSEGKIGSTLDFLQGEFFWKCIKTLYKNKFETQSFNTFFWTVRTMLLPFIQLFRTQPLEADLYHTVSTGYAGILGVYFSESKNKPLLLTEHGIYSREREEEILKAKWVSGVYKKLWIDFFYFISKAAYSESEKIVSLFERNRCIQHQIGAPADKTIVIPNGVDVERYSVNRDPHKGFNIGAILRVVPIKDVMTLIRAFKIVSDSISPVKLYLIGPTDEDPDYFMQCRELVRLLNLEESVVFTGRADVREYMKKIDVMVLTSISEGQPLVILEGMASGIPFVSTDVGSCRELLEKDGFEGDCGIITDLVSPNETAAMILRLLENPALRKEMGSNGRMRVKRAYRQDQFISAYRQLYSELG